MTQVDVLGCQEKSSLILDLGNGCAQNICSDFIATKGGRILTLAKTKQLFCHSCNATQNRDTFQQLVCPHLILPAMQKHLFCHSHNVKTLLAMPKHFSCHSRHTKTLVLPFPLRKTFVLKYQLRQNTFLAISATPKHFSNNSHHARTLFCHSRYAKTLVMPYPLRQYTIPGHTWQCLVTAWQHLVQTWQHLVSTWQHMVTHGNTWSLETAKFHFSTILQKGATNKSFSYLNISC